MDSSTDNTTMFPSDVSASLASNPLPTPQSAVQSTIVFNNAFASATVDPQNVPSAVTMQVSASSGASFSTPAHTKALVDFMRQLHLEQYTPEMIEQGYDDLNFMSTLSAKDLQGVAALVKMLPGHAAKFVAAMTHQVTTSVSSASASSASASSSSSSATADAAADSYVVCVVDRSGSMSSMGTEVKNGFNTFLAEQQKLPGNCLATIVKFDNKVEVVHHGVKLNDIPPATNKTFEPRGMTALYDGIGDAIEMVKQKISTLASKPSRVMVMVLTDGEENTSQRHSHAEVMKTIRDCENKLKWTFTFIGANQDAIATGTKMGFSAQNCLTYAADSMHQRATWSNISANVCRQRGGGVSSWTPEERHTSIL